MGASTPDYAVDRIVETIIGAVIGFNVNLVLVPPIAIGPAKAAVDALGEEVAATLDRLARALERPQPPVALNELIVTARLLAPMRAHADAAIEAADESLRMNPRGARHRARLVEIVGLRDRFAPIVTQVIGMTRAFCDRYDDDLCHDPIVAEIAEQLHRAAHDARFLVRRADAGPEAPETTTIPALTRPMRVAKPTGDNWILVGSLLEDLRRVHEELTEGVEA